MTFHRFCTQMAGALYWCAREPFVCSCRSSCKIHIGPVRCHEQSCRATSTFPGFLPQSHTCDIQMRLDIFQHGCSVFPPFQRWTHIVHKEATPDGPPSYGVPTHKTWVPVFWRSVRYASSKADHQGLGVSSVHLGTGQALERLDSHSWNSLFCDASYGSCTCEMTSHWM